MSKLRLLGFTWSVLLGLLLVASVGCGGDDDGDGAAGGDAAANPTAVPATTSGDATGDAMGDSMGEPVVSRVIISNPGPSVESNNVQKDLNPPAGMQLKPIYESLVGYNADTAELEPQLAKSWNFEPDGFSFHFVLQEGVKFHGDNGEFSAKDVVYSHSQHAREDATHTHSRQYRAGEIEVIGDHEVVLRLPGPNAELLRLMSELNMSSLDISSADDAASIGEVTLLNRPPAGTGVYQFVSRAQGENVIFERVPYEHWRLEADFPELEFRWVSEASTRIASLIAGEVHITQLPQDQTEEALNAGMALSVGTVDAQRVFLGFQGVYVDSETACGYKYCDTPFLDLKVRKAMNKALDKTAINAAFFADKGKLMYMNHMSPSNPYNNPDWERNFASEYGFDPAAARALLAEAGYNENNPLEFDVHVTTSAQFTQSADVLEAAAGYWNDIGIKTNLLSIDPAISRATNRELGFQRQVNFHGTPDFDIQGWRVRQSSVPPRGNNIEHLELEPIVTRLRGTVIPDEQNQILRELSDAAYPLHVWMPLFWVPAELVYDPRVVESYVYPGSPPGLYSHFHRIKAVKK